MECSASRAGRLVPDESPALIGQEAVGRRRQSAGSQGGWGFCPWRESNPACQSSKIKHINYREGAKKNKVFLKTQHVFHNMPWNDYEVQKKVPASHRKTKTRKAVRKIKENDDSSIMGQKENEVIKGSCERMKARRKKRRSKTSNENDVTKEGKKRWGKRREKDAWQ